MMRAFSSSFRPLRSAFGRLTFCVGVGTAFVMNACELAYAQADLGRPSVPSTVADPVSAAIAEASVRFGVPEAWIRAVMRVESAGNPAAVSSAGAMGLMQVMPGTYADLRRRYGLGADPFAIRDNVMAGTANLREMFDRYGSPGFLAAYNAGPGRWEDHVYRGRPLPGETTAYLAKLAPSVAAADAQPSVPAPSPPPPSPFESPLFVVSANPIDARHGDDADGEAIEPLVRHTPANSLFVSRPVGEGPR